MLESIVIANEVIHDARSKKKKVVIFKVDCEKAFDSIKWDFLSYMMRRLGFCETWMQWIESCLKSARISILVNGSPGQDFVMERGVRQGDPLAPFLYLIIA